MYVKGEVARINFFYADATGQPVTGAVLTSLVRRDYGSWQTSVSSTSEPSPGLAPGFYDLPLTATETDCDHLDWYIKAADGSFVAAGQVEFTENPLTTAEIVFNGVFAEPTDATQLALQCAFMDRVADHVLRRGQGNAELSSHGDSVAAGSLLGVVSLMTQGQMVSRNCDGDSYIFLNSAIQGNAPLGSLRVVLNTDGTPIGILPMFGPNAEPDAAQNCECP